MHPLMLLIMKKEGQVYLGFVAVSFPFLEKNELQLRHEYEPRLILGNFLNSRTNCGGACGLNLDALTILPGVKIFHEGTMPHYIVYFVEQNFPGTFLFTDMFAFTLVSKRFFKAKGELG